jgi:hypothetical protein
LSQRARSGGPVIASGRPALKPARPEDDVINNYYRQLRKKQIYLMMGRHYHPVIGSGSQSTHKLQRNFSCP